MSQEPWLTRRELASTLKVSVRTITRHIQPDVRVGGQNRYLMSSALRQLRGIGEDGAELTVLKGAR